MASNAPKLSLEIVVRDGGSAALAKLAASANTSQKQINKDAAAESKSAAAAEKATQRQLLADLREEKKTAAAAERAAINEKRAAEAASQRQAQADARAAAAERRAIDKAAAAEARQVLRDREIQERRHNAAMLTEVKATGMARASLENDLFARQRLSLKAQTEFKLAKARGDAALTEQILKTHFEKLIAISNRESGFSNTPFQRMLGNQSALLAKIGPAAQQAGYQVADFAVQVGSGQSAMVAFTQQAPQFLGFFGTIGSLIGAAVAVGGALWLALNRTKKEAQDLGSIGPPKWLSEPAKVTAINAALVDAARAEAALTAEIKAQAPVTSAAGAYMVAYSQNMDLAAAASKRLKDETGFTTAEFKKQIEAFTSFEQAARAASQRQNAPVLDAKSDLRRSQIEGENESLQKQIDLENNAYAARRRQTQDKYTALRDTPKQKNETDEAAAARRALAVKQGNDIIRDMDATHAQEIANIRNNEAKTVLSITERAERARLETMEDGLEKRLKIEDLEYKARLRTEGTSQAAITALGIEHEAIRAQIKADNWRGAEGKIRERRQAEIAEIARFEDKSDTLLRESISRRDQAVEEGGKRGYEQQLAAMDKAHDAEIKKFDAEYQLAAEAANVDLASAAQYAQYQEIRTAILEAQAAKRALIEERAAELTIQAKERLAKAERGPVGGLDLEGKTAELQAQQDAELRNFKGTLDGKKALQQAHDAEMRSMRRLTMQEQAYQIAGMTSGLLGAADSVLSRAKKNAEAHKRIQSGIVIINTAAAVMKTWNEFGGLPFGVVPAGIMAATGGLQLAAVQKQEFREGGYTGDGHPGTPAGVVHKAEYVVNASKVSSMGGPGGVERALQGGGMTSGGGDVYQFGDVVFQGARTEQEAYRLGQAFTDGIRDRTRNQKVMTRFATRNRIQV